MGVDDRRFHILIEILDAVPAGVIEAASIEVTARLRNEAPPGTVKEQKI